MCFLRASSPNLCVRTQDSSSDGVDNPLADHSRRLTLRITPVHVLLTLPDLKKVEVGGLLQHRFQLSLLAEYLRIFTTINRWL